MIILQPHIEPIQQHSMWDRPRFRLVEDWHVTLDDGLVIVTPAGFETDLASIPRLLWAVPGFSPTGALLQGSILHDFGYQYQYLLTPFSSKSTYPESSLRLRQQFPELFTDLIPVFVGRNQEFFDSLLSGITIETSGSYFVANAAKLALTIFGGTAWDSYRQRGPSAHNQNSLGLPGITVKGEMF